MASTMGEGKQQTSHKGVLTNKLSEMIDVMSMHIATS